MIAPLFFMLIALSISIVLALSNEEHSILLGLSILPSVLCAVVIVIKRDRDLFSPVHLLLYMTLIGIFLKAVYVVHFDHDGLAQRVNLGDLDLTKLWGGLWVLGVGTTAALAGYLMIPLGRPPDKTGKLVLDQRRIRVFLILALLVGSAAFLVFFRTMDIGSAIAEGAISAKRVHEDTIGNAPRGAALGYLRMVAQTLPQVGFFFLLAGLAYYKRRPNKTDLALLFSLASLSLLLPFLTSSRLEMVYLILISLVILHYTRKRVSILRGLTISVFFLIFLTIMGQLRVMSSSTQDVEFDLDLQSVLQATLARGYFMDIVKTSVIYDAVPERVEFQNGKTLVLFLLGPIPRSIWPEKPAIRIGLFVGQEIYGRENDSGTPPGFMGELYLNFAMYGVIIGMFIWGMINALFYRYTIIRNRTPTSILAYSIGTLILSFTLLTGDLTIAMSHTFRYGIFLLLIWWIARHKPRSIPKGNTGIITATQNLPRTN